MEEDPKTRAVIAFHGGERKGTTISLDADKTTIGRNHDHDIVVPDQRISTDYAEIYLDDGKFFIKDLNSTNDTFINSKPVTEAELHDGDLLEIGDVPLLFKWGEFSEDQLKKVASQPAIEMIFAEDDECGSTLEFSLDTREVKLAARDVS